MSGVLSLITRNAQGGGNFVRRLGSHRSPTDTAWVLQGDNWPVKLPHTVRRQDAQGHQQSVPAWGQCGRGWAGLRVYIYSYLVRSYSLQC